MNINQPERVQMKEFTGNNVKKSSWCDLLLIGIKWENDGRDLVFHWQSGDNCERTLTCTWASAIKLGISFAENEGGYPLTWDTDFSQLPSEEWKISLNFGTKGVVELVCNEVILQIA